MSEPRTFEEFHEQFDHGPDWPGTLAYDYLRETRRKAWEASDKATRAALLADRPDVAGLVNRLRGIYTIPVNDGAGPLNGSNTFTRLFDTAPILHEAARVIESLAAQLAAMTTERNSYKINATVCKADLAASQEEVKRLREIMRELLDSEATPCPPFESGKEAQDAWADRRAKARNDAEAATKEPTR